MSDPLTIHRLTIHNVGGVAFIDVTIEGKPVVVFGGNNEAGKTWILRALAATLGAEAPLPGRLGSADSKMSVQQMLRDDELAGDVRLDLGGGVIAQRKWTHKAGKEPTSKLYVEGLDTTGGAVTALKRLWSKVAVRLDHFEQLDADAQADKVRELLDVDWSDKDAAAAKHREERKILNANIKRLSGHLSKLDPCADAGEPADTEKLLAELKRRQEHNAGVRPLQQALRDAELTVHNFSTRVANQNATILRLERELEEARAQRDADDRKLFQERQKADDAKAAVAAFEEQPVDDVEEQLRTADETNRRVRAKEEHERVTAELAAEQKAADEHTAAIERIAHEKRQQLAAIGDRCPVEGLSFDQWGRMLLDGRPYRENSTGRRMRFIVPLMLRACPRIKVLLVDELPLDEENLRLVTELAAAEGGQVIAAKLGKEGADYIVEGGKLKC
jgi:hypothetical protein